MVYTPSYEYDAANQLVAQTTDAGTAKEKRVEFAYDGAGRMIREGRREYRYGGLDKVVAVLQAGKTVAEFAYGADGQLASIERKNGEHERLWWRGLALTRRDYLDGDKTISSERYLNEPHATGGNPVLAWEGKAAPASAKEQARAAATRLLFNDMLGSTLAVLDGDKAQDTGMTLFGETPDGQAQGFFTGKPHIDELGYAFLFRNYRPEKAKWQTADPLGYPDGWNCLAYVNNGVCLRYDYAGLIEGISPSERAYISAQTVSGKMVGIYVVTEADLCNFINSITNNGQDLITEFSYTGHGVDGFMNGKGGALFISSHAILTPERFGKCVGNNFVDGFVLNLNACCQGKYLDEYLNNINAKGTVYGYTDTVVALGAFSWEFVMGHMRNFFISKRLRLTNYFE